ncbi:hypothetical protein GGF32_004488 [Allomyces javanicus]|nr:hypothetical protein GGF32_004488 [Allomyces javanicus]
MWAGALWAPVDAARADRESAPPENGPWLPSSPSSSTSTRPLIASPLALSSFHPDLPTVDEHAPLLVVTPAAPATLLASPPPAPAPPAPEAHDAMSRSQSDPVPTSQQQHDHAPATAVAIGSASEWSDAAPDMTLRSRAWSPPPLPSPSTPSPAAPSPAPAYLTPPHAGDCDIEPAPNPADQTGADLHRHVSHASHASKRSTRSAPGNTTSNGQTAVAKAVEDDAISSLDEVEAEFFRMQARGTAGWISVRAGVRLAIMAAGSFLGGAVFTVGPGVAAYILWQPGDPAVLDRMAPVRPVLATELLRWSIWATTLWALLVVTFTLVKVFRKWSPDQSQLHHSLKVYQYYASVAVSLIAAFIAFQGLFRPNAVAYHSIASNVIATCMVLAIVGFLQKLLMYMTAWNYYQTAYESKETKKVFALSTLHLIENVVLPDTPAPSIKDSLLATVEAAIARRTRTSLLLDSDDNSRPGTPASLPGIVINPDPLATPASTDDARSSTSSSDGDPAHKKRQRKKRRRASQFSLDNLRLAIPGASPGGSVPPSRRTSLERQVTVKTRASYLNTSESTDAVDKYSPQAAKKRAKLIYHRLTRSARRSRVIELKHLVPFYLAADADATDESATEEATRAFALFDMDGNGDVTYTELVDAVQAIYADCLDLAKARTDLAVVLSKLDRAMWSVSLLITVVCSCIVWGVDVAKVLVPLGSFLVALSFAFGSTVRNMFESVVFVFSTHAFDVGDRVYIDQDNVIVREIGLLSTTFERVDGAIIYAPNFVLQTKPILNVRRSPPMSETIKVHVAFNTPTHKIHALEALLNDFLRAHSRDYLGGLYMQVFELENVNRLELRMFLDHKSNWQDSKKRWMRRTKFMAALRDAMMQLSLEYTLPRAVHDVDFPHGAPGYAGVTPPLLDRAASAVTDSTLGVSTAVPPPPVATTRTGALRYFV